MPRPHGARNWTEPETVQLTELVFNQRKYLRPTLRKNMINKIWGEIAQELGNVRSVSQLKNKWASICKACGNDVTTLEAANLPQEVKNKMRLILEEEDSLGQSVDNSDSVNDSDRADENQSLSDENGDPTAQDNTPASPSIAGGSNSSNPDEQNQTERQHNLDSEEQNQDGIENLTGKLETLDCK